MPTVARNPVSDAAIRIEGRAHGRPPDVRLLFRFGLGTALGAAIGAVLARMHARPGSGGFVLVEFEFLATGFAMLGGLFALIGATPAMRGWGEESADG